MSVLQEQDLTPVLQAVTEALTHKFPRARYRVVNAYYFLKVATALHLPEWVYDRFPVLGTTVRAAKDAPTSLPPVPAAVRTQCA